MDTSKQLNDAPDSIAPDGLEVRLLAAGQLGGMAHFRLGPRSVGRAILHEELEEIWYCLSGSGEVWLSPGCDVEEDPIVLIAGVSFVVRRGVAFQLRNLSDIAMDFVGVTMPPWPGDHAVTLVEGRW
jgi:mannose-6-phosphate isomerase-like protein (cupin superfamily)